MNGIQCIGGVSNVLINSNTILSSFQNGITLSGTNIVNVSNNIIFNSNMEYICIIIIVVQGEYVFKLLL